MKTPVRFLTCLLAAAVLQGGALAQEDPDADQGITWKDLLGTDATFQLYGFVRLDAMYDDSRFNDPLIPIWVRSEDPAPPGGVPAGVVAPKDDSEFAMSGRLTRLGIKLNCKQVEGLGDPHLGGQVEVDFYNIGLPDSDSRNALRMRLAYLTLTWGRWVLLAGQDWDVISPLYPVVNNDIVMWGAGNTGDRRPQLTLKNTTPLGGGELITEVGAALTGAVGGTTVSGGLRSGENSGRPMLNARVGYHRKTDAGGSLQVGVWGHDSEEKFDPTGAGGPEMRFDSHSLGFDFQVPVHSDRAWVKGEYFTGENLRDIRGGILQGVNATTLKEIDGEGGFVEAGFQATEHCTVYAGYAYDDPEDGDLSAFQRAANEVPYVAARWRYGDLRLGLEYLNWTTEYVGLADGEAHRVVGWIALYF